MTSVLPLSGVTVLALEHAIAGPLCTRQLAELGADVIKIERPGKGDFARDYDQRVRGQSSHFVWTNRSKRSLTLDLKHPRSAEILNPLLARADVVLQNLAPGATARLGLDYNNLHKKHSRLIVCDISGYGNAGPYRDRKAYDLLIQSEAGFLSVTGTGDQPAKAGIPVADIAAGMQATHAILAALLLREKTRTGSHIEISLLEAMVEWMGFPLYYAYAGQSPPLRAGTDHGSIYPYGEFALANGGHIMLGVQNEREWRVFCDTVLQQPALATDARFDSNGKRSAARDALRNVIESVFATLAPTELFARLETARIAWAQVNDMAAVWQHPQLAALKRQVQIATPAGAVAAFKPPGNNNRFDASMGPVPAVGEHNEAILASLGFTTDDIRNFRAVQVI